MKRLALAAIAAATFAAPLLVSTEAAARERNRGHEYNDHRGYRHDGRHDYRDGRRDQRRADRWDDRRFNGYYRGDRWYYGPPPAHWRDQVRYDYRGWRRGQRLAPYYRTHYRPIDYRYARLRPPPRGYHYVRDDRGDYLLVGIATGVILSVILSDY